MVTNRVVVGRGGMESGVLNHEWTRMVTSEVVVERGGMGRGGFETLMNTNEYE